MKTIGKLITVIFPIFTWYAFSNEVVGMQNVSLFIAWIFIALWSWMALSTESNNVHIENLREKGFSTSMTQSVFSGVATIAIFVYYGAIITAVFYLFGIMSRETIRQEVEKEKE